MRSSFSVEMFVNGHAVLGKMGLGLEELVTKLAPKRSFLLMNHLNMSL